MEWGNPERKTTRHATTSKDAAGIWFEIWPCLFWLESSNVPLSLRIFFPSQGCTFYKMFGRSKFSQVTILSVIFSCVYACCEVTTLCKTLFLDRRLLLRVGMPTSLCRQWDEMESPVLHTTLTGAIFHLALYPLSSMINCAWVIRQVRNILHNTIHFTRLLLYAGMRSLYWFLKTSSYLSLAKYALDQHFHTKKSHLICFWKMFTIICTCFACQGN